MKMKTILLIILLAAGAMAQGIQPQYPDGTTMTVDQFEMDFCAAQHWSSQEKPYGIHIKFEGKWTDDEKVEFGERCMKFVRAGTLSSGGDSTGVTLTGLRFEAGDSTLVTPALTNILISSVGTTTSTFMFRPLPTWNGKVQAWVNGMPEVSK